MGAETYTMGLVSTLPFSLPYLAVIPFARPSRATSDPDLGEPVPRPPWLWTVGCGLQAVGCMMHHIEHSFL
jgi:hypothetical protein